MMMVMGGESGIPLLCLVVSFLSCMSFSMHCDGADVLFAPIPIDGFRAARSY